MEIVTIECMNFMPHYPHEWREGFLWLRKRKCEGVPPSTSRKLCVNVTRVVPDPPHRHYLGFCPEKSNGIMMTWVCLDPFCNAEYFKFRLVYVCQTLNIIPKDGRTVIYKKQKI